MVKRGASNEGYIDASESKNWNVAKTYAETKIAYWLIQTDRLYLTAIYGKADIAEEIIGDRDYFRQQALEMLSTILGMVIDNSLEFVKHKNGDYKKMEDWLKDCEKFDRIITSLFQVSKNASSGILNVKINEKEFSKILGMLRKIKRSMIKPLNNADLIFTSEEEFDPVEYKEEFMKKLKEVG